MSRTFVVAFVVGLAVIAISVAGVLYMQRGAHIDLQGKILKVRTAPLDENSAVAVIDFRMANPADYPFEVRTVTVTLEDPAGNRVDGQTISETDARRMFELLPLLGQKFNPTLVMRDRLAPHASEDRMVAARFEVPESRVGGRKRFLLEIEEVDGKIVEYSEK
jgi:hypothetical protein